MRTIRDSALWQHYQHAVENLDRLHYYERRIFFATAAALFAFFLTILVASLDILVAGLDNWRATLSSGILFFLTATYSDKLRAKGRVYSQAVTEVDNAFLELLKDLGMSIHVVMGLTAQVSREAYLRGSFNYIRGHGLLRVGEILLKMLEVREAWDKLPRAALEQPLMKILAESVQARIEGDLEEARKLFERMKEFQLIEGNKEFEDFYKDTVFERTPAVPQ